MNPELYLNISKIDPLLKKLIDPSTPTIKGQLQNGVIIPSENGKRGLGWLYSVWDQIDFKKYTKYSKLLKDNIIDMSKISKDEAFLDKWLVIPPIYRPYVEDKKRPGLYIKAKKLLNDCKEFYKEYFFFSFELKNIDIKDLKEPKEFYLKKINELLNGLIRIILELLKNYNINLSSEITWIKRRKEFKKTYNLFLDENQDIIFSQRLSEV
jgi:hypothetical protein